MGKILSYILDYLKRILIITFVNFIIVSIVYLIKNQFTLYNLGHGLFVGGLVMSLIGGLALLGFGNAAHIDARNTYITRYNGDKFGSDYIKERNKNMSFTLVMLLSGLFSIIIGYIL